MNRQRIIIFLMLVFMCGICAAQNSDDASKYMSNPNAALVDAKTALRAGDYERARKLATIYNALTNSNHGNEVINEAETHLKYADLLEDAKDNFVSEDYIEALYNYMSAYSLFDEDASLYHSIERCCKALVSNNKGIIQDAEMADLLFKVYSNSSLQTEQSQSILQVSALLGNGNAARLVGNQFKEAKEYKLAADYLEIARSSGLDVFGSLGYVYYFIAKDASGEKKNRFLRSSYECYLESARRGDKVSQYNLGNYLKNGTGTNKDLYAARYWYEQSFLNGYEKAKSEFDSLDRQLTKNRQDSLRIASATNGVAVSPVSSRSSNKNYLDIDAFLPNASLGGVTYSYNKAIPISFSYMGSYHQYSYRIECGFPNTDFVYKGTTTAERIDSDVSSVVDVSTKSYRPSFSIVVAPGLWFNYFSFDLGIGMMFNPVVFVEQSSTSNDGKVILNTSTSYGVDHTDKRIVPIPSDSMPQIHFMLQPKLSIFLPILDEAFFVSAHIGYNYYPTLKDLNGFVYGIGFFWDIEYFL